MEPGLNGLQFFPDANTEHVAWTRDNRTVYCDSGQTALGAPHLPEIVSGEAFIFRDDVLHAGALNLGKKTRVSVEITFVPVGPA